MKSKIKILLITGSFPPAFAPRMGFLCKHIAQHTNWSVDCLCSNRNGTGSHAATFVHLDGYVRDLYMYKRDDGIHEVTIREILRKIFIPKYFFLFLGKIIYRLLGVGFSLGVKRIIRELHAEGGHYDLILTSSGGDRVYEYGQYATELFKCPIIHDFRDILEQEIRNNGGRKVTLGQKVRLGLRNKAIKKASWITCVTRGQYDILKEFNSNISLIHNGYDPNIFSPCMPVRTKNFNIIYVGSIYNGQYPIELVCESLIAFCQKHSDVNVLFYSPALTFNENILPLVGKSSVSQQFVCMETRPQTEMKAVIETSSVLLGMLYTRQGGVECISSKIYEYLVSNRPILFVKNKSFEKLEVIEIITDTNAGAVVDSKTDAIEFLEKKYQEWVERGVVAGTTIEKEIIKFSRATEGDEYIQLIKSVLNHQC